MKQKFLLVAVFSLLIIALGGCAGQPAKTPEQALLERAHAYWNAAKIRDVSTLYNMESDALDGTLTADSAARRLSPKSTLLSYEFKQVQIDDQQAMIKVETQVTLPQFHQPFNNIVKDHWVLIDGQWYHRTAKSFWQEK